MGCCSSRDNKPAFRAIPSPLVNDDQYSYSIKAREIASHMDAIMTKSCWTTHIDEPHCSIRTSEGSPFDSYQPVLYVKVVFEKGTPHEELLKVLTSPAVRIGWDKTFISMEVNQAFSAWHYTTRTIVDTQIPFFKCREFVEEKTVTRDKDNLVMLFHSIETPVTQT
jgi:hypothetical protein